MPAHQDVRPVADRVADELRDRIQAGQIDDRLPGENVLAAEFEVSRDSIRRALARLEREGLIVTGSWGRHVRRYDLLDWRPATFEHRDYRRDNVGRGQDAWTADVADQGRTPTQEVEVALVRAPQVVARMLDMAEDTTVVVRRRRRDVDGIPWQLADSYYPRDIAEGSPIMEPDDVTIAGGLMAAVGHEQTRFHDEIRVRMPTHEETVRLELPPMTPVAEHVRTGYDDADRAVRVIVTIAPGDRHRIIYDVGA